MTLAHTELFVSDDPSNRLGLDYRAEAAGLPYRGPILDVHTHLNGVEPARRYFEAAAVYGVRKTWSMSQLEEVEGLREAFGERIGFIAAPNYFAHDRPETFTSDWLWRIERFAEKGVRICKFFAAPRGADMHEALRLGSAAQREQMRLACSLGMMLMVHVADPDVWFATTYADAGRYGSKASHYEALERLLEEFGDSPWLAAHMAGTPEDLERLQGLLDRYPHLHVDTSATKWMVRELSRRADELADFCRRNSGRVLFGSDIVTPQEEPAEVFDLYASRYWALRTLLESDYEGPSPIADPDLAKLDPALPEDATAHLRGARLDEATLREVYHDAAWRLLEGRAGRGTG